MNIENDLTEKFIYDLFSSGYNIDEYFTNIFKGNILFYCCYNKNLVYAKKLIKYNISTSSKYNYFYNIISCQDSDYTLCQDFLSFLFSIIKDFNNPIFVSIAVEYYDNHFYTSETLRNHYSKFKDSIDKLIKLTPSIYIKESIIKYVRTRTSDMIPNFSFFEKLFGTTYKELFKIHYS